MQHKNVDPGSYGYPRREYYDQSPATIVPIPAPLATIVPLPTPKPATIVPLPSAPPMNVGPLQPIPIPSAPPMNIAPLQPIPIPSAPPMNIAPIPSAPPMNMLESVITAEADSPRYTGFILLIIVLGIGIYFMNNLPDFKEIERNWPKYRCSPQVLPFAAFYGHDTAENFQFCMKNIFSGYAGEILGPFYGIMGGFVKVLMNLIQSANSMRVMFATMGSGISTIFQEFTSRFSQFMMRIRVSTIRMKFLIYRVMGIMTSVMYMGTAGLTSALNFGDSVVFDFLDTFCFPPDTIVNIKGKGPIPIRQVEIGDVFEGSGQERVEGRFRFMADGQAMVRMADGTIVSSNHYVLNSQTGAWVPAYRHPDANPYDIWMGGATEPLICLNTSTHTFPIGSYIYRDYDESSDGDAPCMAWVEKKVNGSTGPGTPYQGSFEGSLHPETIVRMSDGSIMPIKAVQLGQKLANHGTVIGKVERVITKKVHHAGTQMAASTLVWSPKQQRWVRAAFLVEEEATNTNETFISLIVSNSVIELENGTVVRDYLEVMSKDTKAIYDEVMEKM
jgi:hypothetical protein